MRSSKLCSNCFASLSWNYSSNPKHAGQKSSVLQNKKQYAGDLLTHCAPPKPCATALVLANVWKTKKVESFFQAGCSNGDELMEHFVFLVTVRSTTVFFQHSETFIASSLVAMCSACCPTIFFFISGIAVKHVDRVQKTIQWLIHCSNFDCADVSVRFLHETFSSGSNCTAMVGARHFKSDTKKRRPIWTVLRGNLNLSRLLHGEQEVWQG